MIAAAVAVAYAVAARAVAGVESTFRKLGMTSSPKRRIDSMIF
jgi:hypothetical protein